MIRIRAITLASNSAKTIMRFRPSKFKEHVTSKAALNTNVRRCRDLHINVNLTAQVLTSEGQPRDLPSREEADSCVRQMNAGQKNAGQRQRDRESERAHERTDAQTQARKHGRTRARTHTHTHKHKHTHTYTKIERENKK